MFSEALVFLLKIIMSYDSDHIFNFFFIYFTFYRLVELKKIYEACELLIDNKMNGMFPTAYLCLIKFSHLYFLFMFLYTFTSYIYLHCKFTVILKS